MCAILAELKPGDEVIVPSYTFVSTALAFVREGAKVVFADSGPANPNLDAGRLEELITPRTRAIVPVHYAGIACDMDKIMALADKYNLLVIEDAAQAIDSYYKGRPLGSIGHLAAFFIPRNQKYQRGGRGFAGDK
jgi:dTDP-4-amino-4,6-dideoxygalactose transaminase